MAILFSFSTPPLTLKEARWCNRSLAGRENRAEMTDGQFFEWELYVKTEYQEARTDEGFLLTMSAKQTTHLRIHSQYGGAHDKAAAFMQRFLQKFRPDRYVVIWYADVLWPHQDGGYGGGYIVVSADDIIWSDPSNYDIGIAKALAESVRGIELVGLYADE